MKNVTITLDEEVARWARIRAAEEDTSLSRLVGELLREKMLHESDYQTSVQNYLAQSPPTWPLAFPERTGHQRRGIPNKRKGGAKLTATQSR